jgi:hypothetical protein
VPKTDVRVLQSIRFRFALHSNSDGECQAILWLEVVALRKLIAQLVSADCLL